MEYTCEMVSACQFEILMMVSKVRNTQVSFWPSNGTTLSMVRPLQSYLRHYTSLCSCMPQHLLSVNTAVHVICNRSHSETYSFFVVEI